MSTVLATWPMVAEAARPGHTAIRTPWVALPGGSWNGRPAPFLQLPSVKIVIAIVRPERANHVLEALYRAEVRGLSMSRVQGHGGETERVETYRGTTVKMGLSEKVRFEIGVSDHFVEPTVNAIIEGARTGEVGDGKTFVPPVDRVVRIRTGELDTAAVTPVEPS